MPNRKGYIEIRKTPRLTPICHFVCRFVSLGTDIAITLPKPKDNAYEIKHRARTDVHPLQPRPYGQPEGMGEG